jgi:hypothetical protein
MPAVPLPVAPRAVVQAVLSEPPSIPYGSAPAEQLVVSRLPAPVQVVQTAAGPGPVPPAFVEVQAPVQRAEAAPVPAPGGPGGGAGEHSDVELDQLAHQLYDRLRSRLRMELLVDRERAGLITDLR